MIKKNWKVLLITSIVILLPILAGLLLWEQLPQQVPFHWNVQGEVDQWASKPVAVFLMPLMLLAIQWLCVWTTQADPKKQGISEKMFQLVLWIVPVLAVVLCSVVYLSALGQEIRMEVLMPILVGLLFVIIGNYLPKCKQSYTMGIKLPWTLNSEENWNKTHRLAGWLWTVCGLGMTLVGFLGGFWLLMVILGVMVLVPAVYSYLLYRKGI